MSGRDENGLPGGDGVGSIIECDVGLTFQDIENFLDRMQMLGRAKAGIAPLLEDAELRGT